MPVSCGWAGEQQLSPAPEDASPQVLQEAVSGAQVVPVPAPDSPAARTLEDSSGHLETPWLGGYAMNIRHLLEPRFGAGAGRGTLQSCPLWAGIVAGQRGGTRSQHPLSTFPLRLNTPRNKGPAFSLQTSDFPSDAIVFWLLFQMCGNLLAQRLGVCTRLFSLSRIQLGALGALEIL